jgi:hypothetical protein
VLAASATGRHLRARAQSWILLAAPAEALATRTLVSGKGADSGACTRAVPDLCLRDRAEQAARSAWSIPASMARLHHQGDQYRQRRRRSGGHSGQIRRQRHKINAGATESIHLRGLTIDGIGVASTGIRFNTGLSLAIENCVVRKFSFHGLSILPSTSSSFSVSNTIASNNGATGILVQPTGSADV